MGYSTLITTAELHEHLDDPRWIVFDCRYDLARPQLGRDEYAKAHVPGAFFVHLDDDLSAPKTGENGRHPLPEPKGFAARLGELGVDEHLQVVAYDFQSGMSAARLWWMLRWLGHENVAVLDGGWQRWCDERRPVTSALPAPRRTSFASKLRPSEVSVEFVQSQLDRCDYMLLDARAPDRYRGENESIDPVAGHIPGALNRFFRDNLDARGAFKPRDVLRAEFGAVIGDTAPERLIHYCGSGVSACHNLLAMEIAGLPGGKLYGGSWSEWIADSSRPTEAGPRSSEAGPRSSSAGPRSSDAGPRS